MRSRRPGSTCVAFAWLAVATLQAGCSTLLAVRGQQGRASHNAVLAGTVESEVPARGPLIVGLLRHRGSELHLVDYFVAAQPGRWVFAAEPGTYSVAAFEDVDGDGRYRDEPALRPSPQTSLVLTAGQQVNQVALRIPQAGRFKPTDFSLGDGLTRGSDEQRTVSLFALCVAGKVAPLEDERFSREHASAGMWRFYDFLLESQCGIYFLTPYDPAKTPVLFVHGLGGTPRDFRALIDGLDQTRYQAWVYYYPSGARLDHLAALLTQLYTRVRLEYRLERLAVIAHSMGGLVAREFLLHNHAANGDTVARTFVSIATPFGGIPSAGGGVAYSPIVVDAWRGLDPAGDFVDRLFFQHHAAPRERRRLPEHVGYHLLFGFRGDSGDGVAPIASQLREEAQEEARSIRGFDEDHTSILRSPGAHAHVEAILAQLELP